MCAMWFKRQKTAEKLLKSEEYETLLRRWTDVEARVRRLEMSEEDFRNKVLRKIQRAQDNQSEDLNNQIALPTTGSRLLGGKANGYR